jgi:hypothetical protein
VADLWTDTPTALPREDGNIFIRNSKWQWPMTSSTGNKLQPKGESEKAHTKTFSDGDTPLMEVSLSKRDTLFRRILHNLQKDSIWTTIWKSKLWPKISTFL